jgi:hypothetical protein
MADGTCDSLNFVILTGSGFFGSYAFGGGEEYAALT